MDVEVYQYLMSRSGVGSTGAGFFMRLITSESRHLTWSKSTSFTIDDVISFLLWI